MNQQGDDGIAVSEEEEENELCFQCMTPNKPGTTFCSDCGAPMSSYAATGPFERLFAEGHVYRKAAETPQSLFVVLGMWVIFGSMALAGGFVTSMAWGAGDRMIVLAGIASMVFSITIIYKTTANFSKKKSTVEAKDES